MAVRSHLCPASLPNAQRGDKEVWLRRSVNVDMMDLKQNVINKLNLEFGKDVKCIGRSHDIYKKLQEEKSSIEKSVNYDNVTEA
jgi:hypothetical protein